MNEPEARDLRRDMEMEAHAVWVMGFRIVNGEWQLEVRDMGADGMPEFIIASREQAMQQWPHYNLALAD